MAATVTPLPVRTPDLPDRAALVADVAFQFHEADLDLAEWNWLNPSFADALETAIAALGRS